jgi:hypothetical protein
VSAARDCDADEQAGRFVAGFAVKDVIRQLGGALGRKHPGV